jgi:hypothetical protein
MCRANDETVPPFGVLLAIACRLSACRLLVCEAGRRRAALRMHFNCPRADVGHALEEDKELPWLVKYIKQQEEAEGGAARSDAPPPSAQPVEPTPAAVPAVAGV